MSDRFTVQLDEENADWVEQQAERRDRSKAWIINESLRAARGVENVLVNSSEVNTSEVNTSDVNTGEVRTGEVNAVDIERVDRLEDRVDELEARIEGSPMAHERDARAEPGQAADGVAQDDPSPVESQNPSERAESGSERSAIDDVLGGAYEDRQFRDERREIGRKALEWLRDQSAPQSGGDFQDALHPKHNVNEQNEDTWWRTTVRPALQAADDSGFVKYRPGHHDYKWTG